MTLPRTLALAQVDERTFEAAAAGEGSSRDVVNGVQLMAYAMASSAMLGGDDYSVKCANGVFLRPVNRSSPVNFDVDRVYGGRAFGSDTVTVNQNGKITARIQLLLSVPEDDLIRHGDSMPSVAVPDECRVFEASGSGTAGLEVRVVGDPDYDTPGHAEQPPSLYLWVKATEPTPVGRISQALLCSGTGTTLIGTAILPHAEVGQLQAHRTISTGVVGHTINFHEPVDLDGWLLLAQESVHAGHGRSHGRGRVFSSDGMLVASYTQDNMIRRFTDGRDHSSDYRTVM